LKTGPVNTIDLIWLENALWLLEDLINNKKLKLKLFYWGSIGKKQFFRSPVGITKNIKRLFNTIKQACC